MVATRFVTAAALLLAGCSGGGGPSSGARDALDEVAAEYDAYHDEHGEYPDPFTLADETDVDSPDLEQWNIVVYYGSTYGYCIEADDTDGRTWHRTRDEAEPAEGECPGS